MDKSFENQVKLDFKHLPCLIVDVSLSQFLGYVNADYLDSGDLLILILITYTTYGIWGLVFEMWYVQ